MDEMWRNINAVDDTITLENTMKAQVQKLERFQDFLQQHCQVQHYVFSVKKCSVHTLMHLQASKVAKEKLDSLHHFPDLVPDGNHFQDLHICMQMVKQPSSTVPHLKSQRGKAVECPSLQLHSVPKMLPSLFSAMNVRSGDLSTARPLRPHKKSETWWGILEDI